MLSLIVVSGLMFAVRLESRGKSVGVIKVLNRVQSSALFRFIIVLGFTCTFFYSALTVGIGRRRDCLGEGAGKPRPCHAAVSLNPLNV